MAVVGYLLFGKEVKDELTKNMLGTDAYEEWVKVVILVLVAILPLTKFPLQYACRFESLFIWRRLMISQRGTNCFHA